jgi:hypothetical protein
MKKLILVLGLTLSLSLQIAHAKKVPADGLAEIGTEVTVGKGGKAAKADKKAAKDAKKAADKAAKADKKGKGGAGPGVRAEPQDPADALTALERHTEALLADAKVVGTGVSWDKDGAAVIKVFTAGKAGKLPKNLDGIKVVKKDVGGFYAMNITCDKRPGEVGCQGDESVEDGDGLTEAATPRNWQNRPVPIGVSIGTDDLTAGTLGCRVSGGCHNYALSNSHVVADTSASLVQPSVADGGLNPDDAIASLYMAVPIVLGTSSDVANRVDAAIFDVETGAVGTATRSSGYGEPKVTTTDAQLGLDVMKYGRSSALTTGYIDTINATVIVHYESGDARFVGQMIIESDTQGVDFTLPGDSGSLVVADGGDDDRKPVGLVFASGKGYTVANPINDVLSALNVNMDGEF